MTTTWDEIRRRLVSIPRSTLHARVRWDGRRSSRWDYVNGRYPWGPGPSFIDVTNRTLGTLHASDLEVWRDGPMLRVEKNRYPLYITDGESVWDFQDNPRRPQLGTPGDLRYSCEAQWLILPPPAAQWDISDQHTTDVYNEQIEGRDAWEITVGGVRVWIDCETFYLLALGDVDSGYREYFAAPDIGSELDPGLFTWDGDVIPAEDLERRRKLAQSRKQEDKRQRSREWLLDNVVADPMADEAFLPLPVTIDLTPTSVPHHNDTTGEFTAVCDGFSLGRRLRGTRDRLPAAPYTYFWTTTRYDWELSLLDGVTLTDQGIQDVWNQLHPGEPVTDYRPPGQ